MHPKRLQFREAKRPKVKDKDHDRLVKKAWEAGWWCERKKSGSVRCCPVTGACVTVHGTANGPRSLDNVKSCFRASGLEV